MFTGGPHHYFLFKSGCWQSVDVDFFWVSLHNSSAGWNCWRNPRICSLSLQPRPTKERARGKHPRKIDKISFPVFRQGCLVFTARGSCWERERKLWLFLFFFPKKRRNWLSRTVFLMDSPEGNAAAGEGSVEQSRRVGMSPAGVGTPWPHIPEPFHPKEGKPGTKTP